MGLTLSGMKLVAEGGFSATPEQVAESAIEISDSYKQDISELKEYFLSYLESIEGDPVDIKSKVMRIRGDKLTYHQLGILRTYGDVTVAVHKETPNFYVGNFVDSYQNFIGVMFKKSDLEEIEEED